ncbi:MAG: DUF6145 family protein [Anaerotignum faecicola]
MAKKILAAANNKEQKYFMEEEFKFLPDTIKEDLKRICVYMAEKLNCTFLVGFDDNGDVYFETIKHEGDFDFDEIGAELEIKRLQKEELELFRAMELWVCAFLHKRGRTCEGGIDAQSGSRGENLIRLCKK